MVFATALGGCKTTDEPVVPPRIAEIPVSLTTDDGESVRVAWYFSTGTQVTFTVFKSDTLAESQVAPGAFTDMVELVSVPITVFRDDDVEVGRTYAYGVRAVDGDGQTVGHSRPARVTLSAADQVSPETTIDGGPSGITRDTTVSFAFSGNDDDAVAGFECALDEDAFLPCDSPLTLVISSQGSHELRIRAYDQTGNRDRSPALATWQTDSVAPVVAFDQFPASSTGSGPAVFGFSATDNLSGVAGFLCKLDAGPFQSCVTGVTFEDLDFGEHSFEVRARDVVGNVSAVQRHEWTIREWLSLSVGGGHACAVAVDRRIWCWGHNSDGQLGTGATGATRHATAPVLASPEPEWVSISAGGRHSCGIKTDESLYCWGRNASGQLGIPGVVTKPTLVDSGPWVQVAAGFDHTCAVHQDNSRWCWGGNDQGQLGDGTTTDRAAPVKVDTSNWQSVSAGKRFGCGIRTNKGLYCWGRNGHGQLGTGTTTPSTVPVEEAYGLRKWDSVSAGESHACAVRTDGVGLCWGRNEQGESGSGAPSNQLLPATEPSGIGAWKQLQAGGAGEFTCGLRADEIVCWGGNARGQLGTGDETPRVLPTVISGGWIQLDTGSDFACGISEHFRLLCWGNNEIGQLGASFAGAATGVPGTVALDWVGAQMVGAGTNTSCAVATDGSLACWGDGSDGQFANGATANASPVPLDIIGDWQQIAVGSYGSCAVSSDSSVLCWGDNSSGQLGGQVTSDLSLIPVVANLPDAVTLAAGQNYFCAVSSDSSIRCWGDNSFGQIGIGSAADQVSVPTTIAPVAGWAQISIGQAHTCGIRSDGIYCWGDNQFGQAGADPVTLTALTAPTRVTDGAWSAIGAAATATCAIRSGGSGQVWCWGDNRFGQLANGTTSATPVTRPAEISGLGLIDLAAGDWHMCGILDDNTINCWGASDFGQAGEMFAQELVEPTPISPQRNWTGIEAGASHSCAIDSANNVWCWGRNNHGQLGNDKLWRSFPVTVELP